MMKATLNAHGRFVDPFDTFASSLPTVARDTDATQPLTARSESMAFVDAIEAAIRRSEPLEIEPVHHFVDGIYAREITIPAGALLTGKIHRTQHLNIISKGAINVWSPGEPVRHIVAPYAFVAQPGTRRVGLALEETVWTTIHATDERDLDKLEVLLIEPRETSSLEGDEDLEGEVLQLLTNGVSEGEVV